MNGGDVQDKILGRREIGGSGLSGVWEIGLRHARTSLLGSKPMKRTLKTRRFMDLTPGKLVIELVLYLLLAIFGIAQASSIYDDAFREATEHYLGDLPPLIQLPQFPGFPLIRGDGRGMERYFWGPDDMLMLRMLEEARSVERGARPPGFAPRSFSLEGTWPVEILDPLSWPVNSRYFILQPAAWMDGFYYPGRRK